MTIDIKKLSLLINDVYDAVDRSKVGPMKLHHQNGSVMVDQYGYPIYNGLAMETYRVALSNVIPKDISGSVDMQ